MAEQGYDTNFEKTHTVLEISKYHVERVILQECGNERTQDSEHEANLRRLLQCVIHNFKEGSDVRENAEIRVTDNYSYSVRIVSGNGENKYLVLMNGSGEIELVKTESPPPLDRIVTANERTFSVNEISKNTVERAILKMCGNDGTQDSEQKANLRRLLHGVKDNFKEGPAVRRNAEIRVSDNVGNSVRIVSGYGQYKYVVLMNGIGEIELIQTSSPSLMSALSYLWGRVGETFVRLLHPGGGNS